MKIFKIAALGFAMVTGPAFADGHSSGDAAAGEKVFKKCKSCHSVIDADGEVVVKGGRNGPNLFGVYTRVAGANEEFGKKYGKSLIEAGEGGLEWNEADFVTYVADPRAFLREINGDKKAKTKMSFKLRDSEDATNVWAYLVSIGPEAEAKTE